jgi:hypothetical protein
MIGLQLLQVCAYKPSLSFCWFVAWNKKISSLLVITSWWLELLATSKTILWVQITSAVHVLPILYNNYSCTS